ncbi:iron-containing redox enzyme family protein [Nocardia bovistercoris]|uniref:Iron-containing redox enzyme family protein n=1 Tax=Nocardia bovistercoris TaxID=2785916 RepID=A0A931IDQ1_9NOCA|nr:iron-containing redox enzyme family protein [Nocardia bovistercoris]MBH0777888.1 iron-containing redox enzyme family protein [Nocardia bovistercoris]
MTVLSAPVSTLPTPRGPASAALCDALRGEPGTAVTMPAVTDPFGEDLHLALHTCYELHYQGFPEVDGEWEWDAGLLAVRAEWERLYLDALRDSVPGGDDLDAALGTLLRTPAESSGPSAYLRDEGDWSHMREYFVHRSIYHHKEADPYAWVIPRLRGQAKASLVAVEFDEFGGGRGDRVHARLYADLLDGAGLDSEYLHYLDVVPEPMLALVNMMSLFGLHRRLRGASVGHFATVEITSPPGAARMVAALTRLDADPACTRFYREHVEADAVHEQVMRREVIGDLLDREPDQRAAVVFGIQVTEFLEDRFADHVLGAWHADRSSLRDGSW